MIGQPLGNSAIAPYLKIAAILILVLTYMAALAYAFWELLRNNGATLPSSVTVILGSGLTYAIQVLSAHQTVSLTEKKGPDNASTPPA